MNSDQVCESAVEQGLLWILWFPEALSLVTEIDHYFP